MGRLSVVPAGLLGLALTAGIPAWADDVDQRRARQLLEEGLIMPLEELLDSALAKRPGRVIEVELEEEEGLPIYEIEVLDPDGNVWEMEFDAQTGELMEEHIE